MPNKIVVLLCGIPGSGKSTASEELCSLLTNLSISCSQISFDEIGSSVMWDDSSYRYIRDAGRSQLISLLDSDIVENSVVIVDDVMHLRSMRRQIYQIARDKNCPILVVWVSTSVAVAWERNQGRPMGSKSRVESGAFNKIVSSFEPPDSSHICDRHHLAINNDTGQLIGIHDVVDQIMTMFQNLDHFIAQYSLSNTDVANNKDYDRQTNDSILKKADELLRECVSGFMKGVKEINSTEKIDVRRLAKLAAVAKSTVLSDLRSKAFADSERLSTIVPQMFENALSNDSNCDHSVRLVLNSLTK